MNRSIRKTLPGTTLRSSVASAIREARKVGILVRLRFNGVQLAVSPESSVAAVISYYTERFGELGDIQK